MSIRRVLERFVAESSQPRRPHGPDSLRLASTVSFDDGVPDPSSVESGEIGELWSVIDAARLFEDVDYGQWGLVLLDQNGSRERTLKAALRS